MARSRRTQRTRVSRASPAPLHATFSPSAAGALVTALRGLGRPRDRVIWLSDRLEIGPIAPADPRSRARWRARNDMSSVSVSAIAHDNAFWRKVVAADDLIVWMSHRAAHEQCGLLEISWRRQRPFQLIDVGAFRLSGSRPKSFGIVSTQTIIERRLLECARTVHVRAVLDHAEQWDQLADEPEPVRIVTKRGLLAVPATHFDDAIIAEASEEWMPCNRLIGTMLSRFDEIGYSQVDVEFLDDRIATLVHDGALDFEVEPGRRPDWRTLRVRRVAV